MTFSGDKIQCSIVHTGFQSSAAVSDSQAPVASIDGLTQRGVHTGLGCNTAQNQVINAILSQQIVEGGIVESTKTRLVDHRFVGQWLAFFNKLMPGLAENAKAAEWSGFPHVIEKLPVGIDVTQIGFIGFTCMYQPAVELSRHCDQPLHPWQNRAHFIQAFAQALYKEFFLQIDYNKSSLSRRKLVASISTALNGNLAHLTPLVLHSISGGAEEDRTPDLRIANAMLSQLSYRPITVV
jgi:hypothetical protein